MKVKFVVNDYVLIWNLLFQASITESIYKLKQKLWETYKVEYNSTYHDKNIMLKDLKNYIPNNDTIYNLVKESKEYERLVKKAEKYRLDVMKLWDSNSKKINSLMKSIVRMEIKPLSILIVNEELNIIDSDTPRTEKNDTIVIGKKYEKKESFQLIFDILLEEVKKELKDNKSSNDLKEAIIELAILNEFATNLTGRSHYLTGKPSLAFLKRQIYPYWLMYLGVPKEEMLNYMMRDKIAFEVDNYAYEKELKKMDLGEFIDFCNRNRKYIIRLEKLEII